MRMTRERIEAFKRFTRRIKALEKDIINFDDRVLDSVTGSSPHFPYIKHTMKIEGIDTKKYMRLRGRHEKEAAVWEKELTEIMEFVNSLSDPVDQTIVELYTVRDMKLKDIGEKLGYVESTISKRLKNLFVQK